MNGIPAGYTELRESAAFRSIERDFYEVTGPEALSYLQGQCSQDLAPLVAGSSIETLLLNPDGKLVALLRACRLDDDRFVLDVDGGFGELVADRLNRFRLRTKVTIEALDWSCVALRGPSVPLLEAELVSRQPLVVAPSGIGGFTGLDLLGPQVVTAVPASIPQASAEAWEARRIESGTPMMGRELDGRTIAAEADLLDRTVSFTKGCYTGQELVARLDARGNKVARHLRGLVFSEGGAGSAGSGAELNATDGRSVGSLTSMAFSPTLSRMVALGYLHRSVAIGDQVSVDDPGAPGESALATVVALPAV